MEHSPILVHSFPELDRPPVIEENQWASISTDWYGDPLDFDWKYCLGQSKSSLYFVVRSSAKISLHPDSSPGHFQSELWRHTVAEIFLFDTNSTSYHEFNLSPDGGWWWCKFSDYRKETGSYDRPNVRTFAHKSATRWTAGLEIPVDYFSSKNLSQYKINICGIVGHNKQVFIAQNSVPGEKPDFHLRELGSSARII